MVKKIVTILCLLIGIYSTGYAIELDQDNNDAVDVSLGGTNSQTAAGARVNLGCAPNTGHYLTDQADSELSAEVVVSANGKSLVTATDYAAMRLLLGVGSYIQAWDADLDTYAGITPSADVQALLAVADNDAARTALGLAIGSDVQQFNAGLTAWTSWADPNKTALLQWDDTGGAFAIYEPTAWTFFYSGSGGALTEVAMGDAYSVLMFNGPAAAPTPVTQLNWDPLIAPNGANPTTDAAGEIAVDTSAGAGSMFRWYGDAAYATPAWQSQSYVIKGCVATDDYPFWKFPYAITIKAVKVYAIGGTSVTGGLDECTGTNGVCSSVTAVDADIVGTAGDEVSDDGSLTNPGIAAGNYIRWHTTSVDGTNTSVTITMYYTVDQVN